MNKRPMKPFAPRTIAMLNSPAWSVVSLAGRRVLDRIEIELARHGGNDNGKLPVTFADFERYGINRHSIGPALRELEHLGFIQITEHGVAGTAGHRSPNLFRLTYRDAAGLPVTDEWAVIASVEQAERIARTARTEKSPPRRVKKSRSRIRTTQFPSGGFCTSTGVKTAPFPVADSAPQNAKSPANREVQKLHHYLESSPSREAAKSDARTRRRRRRRSRLRVRTKH